MLYFAAYIALISLIAVILTVHDKRAAVKHKWRVRESTLLLAAALGGAAAMLVTMRLIRHKTKHAKFMMGLPAIIAVQVVIIALAMWQGWLVL